MPKYEFFVSVKYTKAIEVEADDRDQAYNLACEVKDADIINDGDHEFNCEFNGEVQNA
jgi:hypothetical protein